MKLTSLLEPDAIVVQLDARTKEAAIGEVLRHLQERDLLKGAPGESLEAEAVRGRLMDRERKGVTALGGGVGYPHVRCDDFSNFILAMGLAPDGIDYGAADGECVRLMLIAVVPAEKNALLLGVMACLSQIVADPELIALVVSAPDAEAAWGILDEAGLEVKETIVASDIMKAQFATAPPEMTLVDVASLMHREHLDVLPVADGDGRLLGEVSAQRLFRKALPPYFTEIPSMSFARDFDAFEHFLREKAHLKVSEITERRVHTVAPNAPLAQVIALLAREGTSRLYVVSQGRLRGVIDSFSIIDKVLAV